MKKWISYGLLLVGIPLVLLLGATVFSTKQYAWLAMAVMVLTCVPFFLSFEGRQHGATRLVVIAVLSALSVVGRLLFASLPGAKPVTAMVVITALYFGGEAGFMTGALTAVLSNFQFGQGPWTPFQMFAWGLIGLVAGLLANPLKRSRVALCIYGALSGVLYSLLMDIWSVLWYDGGFNLSRYLATVLTSAPFMAIYAVSNVVFLLVLEKPIGSKLDRIKTKYGI